MKGKATNHFSPTSVSKESLEGVKFERGGYFKRVFQIKYLVLVSVLVVGSIFVYRWQGRLEPVPTLADSPAPITAPAATCNYYASPSGSVGGDGSIGNPWELQTAFEKTSIITSGVTLCLNGGTYFGKFNSFLNGGTVRSTPGQWAVLDGDKTTTLSASIDSSQQLITVASSAGLYSTMVIAIDTEVMQIDSVTGNTVKVNRGWGGTIGGAVTHSAGAVLRVGGNQLNILGSNATYRDFEIRNSYTQRDFEPGTLTGQGCCGFYAILRGSGLVQASGGGNSYINLIIHDNHNGIFIGSNTSNTLSYGNLIYNNGGHIDNPSEGREDGTGHGMYMENSSGYSRVYSTISINNFDFNGQFYGVTGPYVGGDHRNNIFANAGSPLNGLIDPNIRNFNIVYGPNSVPSPTANITGNFYWAPHNAIGGTAAQFGYGAGINNLTLTGNYFVGGPHALSIGAVSTATVTNNQFYSTGITEPFVGATRPTGTWNNNTYHKSVGNNLFGIAGTGYISFANWKSTTGYDSTSTETSTALPDTAVVTPNDYQPGRANIAVFDASGASSINVNLSTAGLTNGQAYVIKNVFNIFGADVVTGTYNSSSPTISLPLTGSAQSVATPVGMSYTPTSTCPDFCAFLLLPSSGGSPSDTTSPSVSITAPAQNATVSGAGVSLSATATDNVGVVGVQFKLDGTNLGAEDTSSPYGITWDTASVSNASHALTAVARDAMGNTATSTTVTVNVNNAMPAVSAPVIAPNGGSFTATQQITLSTATPGANIRYTTDGSSPTSSIGSVYASPFTISTTTTIKAIAYKTSSTDSSVVSAIFTLTSGGGGSSGGDGSSGGGSSGGSGGGSSGGGGSSDGGSSGGSGGGSSGGSSTTTTPSITSSPKLIVKNGTYYLIQNGQRKGITSPGILNSCGFAFSDAGVASSSENSLPQGSLLLPCGGALVKSIEDQTVYIVSNNKRYAFVSANVFLSLGFSFKSVLTVTDPELQTLSRGENISNPSQAHLPEMDININGTIYWIDIDGSKHPYPSLAVYNSWHIDNDFSTVVVANSADLSLQTGNAVPLRVIN